MHDSSLRVSVQVNVIQLDQNIYSTAKRILKKLQRHELVMKITEDVIQQSGE